MKKWLLILLGALVGIAIVVFGYQYYFHKDTKKNRTGFDTAKSSVAADSMAAIAERKAEAAKIDTVSTELPWIEAALGRHSRLLLQRRFDRFEKLLVMIHGPDSTLQIRRRHKAGLDLAAMLLSFYELPWDERSGLCDNGLNLQNGVAVMDTVMSILQRIPRSQPEDIPWAKTLTGADLRQLVLTDLRSCLLQVRSSTADTSSQETDEAYADLMTIIRQGVAHYSFRLYEFGFTPNEESLYTASGSAEVSLASRRHERRDQRNEEDEEEETDE